jgi:hypothetical protein
MAEEQVEDGEVISLKMVRNEYFKGYVIQTRSRCPYCQKMNKHGETIGDANGIFKHKSVKCLACGDPYYLSFSYE